MSRNTPAAFGRLCVETPSHSAAAPIFSPAAFGRLCVETDSALGLEGAALPAAFGRLCVETQTNNKAGNLNHDQPPSGGCVLKPFCRCHRRLRVWPAAFGRLCVETKQRPCPIDCAASPQPPSGGCVLKRSMGAQARHESSQPPSGGCVLKHYGKRCHTQRTRPAAFGRLCVETGNRLLIPHQHWTSRLRAAVC